MALTILQFYARPPSRSSNRSDAGCRPITPECDRDVTELRRKPLGTANVATTLPAYDAPQA